jgi:Rab GDP dissociation inhibitor
MDESYDFIVLGTGLKECILSGLMSKVQKKRVLHMDRNSYYGGESASLNLEQLYERFRGGEKPPAALGRTRDYNVDLCPKFLMACGNLVKVLLQTGVTRYLEFKSVSGSFVFKGGKIHKVPSTAAEALSSGLMGMFQKRYFKNFLEFCANYEKNDPKTHKKGVDVEKITPLELYKKFDCDADTQQFCGHSLALYSDDSYLHRPDCTDFIQKIKLYANSVARYGNSPYIYPVWGLGGLPEGFSRLCAIHGGVYMLNKPVESIVYDENGRVTGVTSGGETAKCTQLIADPSYFIGTDKIRLKGKVARSICILSHPIPNTNADSCQIIFPFNFVNRKSDIYVLCVSSVHQVASKGKYIVVISAPVETANPQAELKPAIDMLGAIDEQFFWVSDMYEAVNDPNKDGCFITSSYDPTSHFESATNEVIEMYERITSSKMDLTAPADLDAPPEDESGAAGGGDGVSDATGDD